MNKLGTILTEMAAYVEATHSVEVDSGMSIVDIRNLETGDSDFFLQGSEADEFIERAEVAWVEAGDVSQTVAYLAEAKTYVDCV